MFILYWHRIYDLIFLKNLYFKTLPGKINQYVLKHILKNVLQNASSTGCRERMRVRVGDQFCDQLYLEM